MQPFGSPRRYRWLLWGVLGVVFLLVNVYRLSTAVLAEELMATFQTTGARLGTLHAVFFYVYAVMQIPTGLLADRVGPRRTAAAGAAVMSAGAIWFSAAGSYWAAIAGRGLVGLGGSVVFVCLLRFCASWYRADEFATMSGLTFAVSGVGGVLATTPLAVAVGTAGWRTTIAVLGVFGLAVALVVSVVVRDSPERAGFDPIQGVPDQPSLSLAELRASLAAVLRDRVVQVVSVMLFCATGINLTLFGLWGVPYVAQTYDVSVTYASLFTLAGSVGLVVGPPTIGWLADHLDERTGLMTVGGACYVLALGTIAAVGDPPLLVVAAIFFLTGAFLGAFVLSYAVVKDRHPANASGVSTGTINGAAFLGASLLPTLMGWALDSYWTGDLVGGVRVYTATGYRVAFAIATVAAAIALGCALWLHRRI